ncbi:MAG: NAD(P)-binding protein [Oscillospiraceae bacterium]
MACPAHIAISYIKMASEGRYKDALKLIKKDNPFPAVCGSICRKYCEDACTRGSVDEPLSIDEIKKFIAEQDMRDEHRYIPPMNSCTMAPFEQKIAIIGAGPAGMSCAYFLAIEGYKPTVFEKEAAPGGILVNGIPNFRVDKATVNSEIDVLREMGVEFRCGVEVGKDVTIQQLREEATRPSTSRSASRPRPSSASRARTSRASPAASTSCAPSTAASSPSSRATPLSSAAATRPSTWPAPRSASAGAASASTASRRTRRCPPFQTRRTPV